MPDTELIYLVLRLYTVSMDGINLKKQSEEIGIDLGNLLSLYTLYMEQTDSDLKEMESLVVHEDSKALRDMAHHIKGASLNLELSNMVNYAKSLQDLAEQSDWNRINTVHHDLKSYFSDLKKYLEKIQHEDHAS